MLRYLLVLMGPLCLLSELHAQPARKPNIVFILADDLGYGDLGCYGQKIIKTPHLDQLSREGVRFTNAYAGNAVCAPSRCVLMTGLHSGHAFIRDNTEVKPEGQRPIPADTVTIATLLKRLGYATGVIGKWGLGPPGSTGDPNRQGFDLFFGYNCQRHAHNHYPDYLWRNDKKIPLDGKTFTHDLFEKESLDFIRENRHRPFFLYLPFTIPHLALQVPEDSLAPYRGKFDDSSYKGGQGYRPHESPRAAYAAMITRMDRTVGRIRELLKHLDLDDNTIVFFSSDNGAVYAGIGGSDPVFFNSTGGLRGFKGSLFEGGIRVPFLCVWPKHIPSGKTSDLPCIFYDVMPTLCNLAGDDYPRGSDGVSILPTLLGKGEQKRHEFLYWEFAGYGGQQSLRMGDWVAIREKLHKGDGRLQLFHLKDDPAQKVDVSAQHPRVVERMTRIMREQHGKSMAYPIKLLDERK